MEDLSHIFARMGSDPITVLAPSSMAGGNRVSDSARQTMTAPGSEPVDPMPPADLMGDPTIGATAYDTPVLRDPDGSAHRADNADRSSSYTEPDGAGWFSSAPAASPAPEITPRSLLRRGEWNNID
jgi:hypothetical protein